MAGKKDRGEPKKLTVTEIVRTIASGDGEHGPWEIKEIKALNAAGAPINETLKTFADVTPLLGKLEEFYVERQDHEKYGTSFLVSPKTSGLQLKVQVLEGRVDALEQRVAQLGQPGNPATPVPQSTPAAAAASSSPATSDDDIPF